MYKISYTTKKIHDFTRDLVIYVLPIQQSFLGTNLLYKISRFLY